MTSFMVSCRVYVFIYKILIFIQVKEFLFYTGKFPWDSFNLVRSYQLIC